MGLNRRKGIKPKKNRSENQIKDWTLFDAMKSRDFNLIDLIESIVPWEKLNTFDKNEVEDFKILLSSYFEETDNLKQ